MNQPLPSSRRKMAVVILASFLLMAYIDYVSGYELIFSAAYLIPVAICAWNFDRRMIWIISAASGLASCYVDFLGGHPYASSMIQYWNGFTCFVISLVTGLLLHRLKRTLEERKRMNTDLQNALEELRYSTEEIRKLQTGLQVVCAWTKKIKVDDRWMTPDEFLRTKLHLKLSHGMSPEASRDFEHEIEQASGTKHLTSHRWAIHAPRSWKSEWAEHAARHSS